MIKVWVSFTDDRGFEETLTSEAIGPITWPGNRPATGAPVIAGTAQVGETLTVDTSGMADADGLTNVSYSYLWQADGRRVVYFVPDPTRFELLPSHVGKKIQVRVTFTDDPAIRSGCSARRRTLSRRPK